MSGLTKISNRETRYQSRCAMKRNIQQNKDREERLRARNEIRDEISNEIRDEISNEVTEELNTIKNRYRRHTRTQIFLTR
jgi:hypothetical protein